MKSETLKLLNDINSAIIKFRGIYSAWSYEHGISFIPMVTSLIFPVFFQAVGSSMKSSFLTVIRAVVLFVPCCRFFIRRRGNSIGDSKIHLCKDIRK